MTDTANDKLTAEEFRQEHGPGGPGVDPSQYDSAVAIDPGTTTGVAAYDYEKANLKTHTLDFWEVMRRAEVWKPLREFVCIVEAPHLTKWGKTQSPPIAYSSGKVAREAELLVEGLELKGLDVIEHDPAGGGSKWDSKRTHQIVGQWEGPDNEHTRDALQLLVEYGFAG